MSSDGECQPQPSKRRSLVVSDSDSSEDSIVGRTHKKRRVYRVVSDAETTDDDSDVPKPVRRRKNYKVVSDDDGSPSSGSEADSQIIDGSTSSEWQSDWESMSEESEAESVEIKRRRKSAKKSPKKTDDGGAGKSGSNAGAESDASDGQSEKCPICLLTFRSQQVATPSSCDHCFCLICITEWSKNINTCPVDRQAFSVIHVRSKVGGEVIRHVPVETRTNTEPQIQEDPTYCEVCHNCDREDRMLLCDGCDLGYHLECLNPPMNVVPMDEWFCPDCSRNSQDDAESVPIDLDEISDLMAEARGLGVSYGRNRTGIPREDSAFGPHRRIPRTLQTERVRANIRAGRDRTRAREVRDDVRVFDPDQPSTSSGIESISENSRSRSPNGVGTSNRARNSRVNASTVGRTNVAKKSSRSRVRKTTRKTKKKRKPPVREGERMVREVRIVEYNADGEREEIVTYVNVAPASTSRRKKRTKRSRKKRKGRRARTVSSLAAALKTAKKRLANTLGMVGSSDVPQLSGPTVKIHRTQSERGALNDSRNRAGITQVSLFGTNVGLDYGPPGSDDEFDSVSGDGGPVLGTHRYSGASATRRRFALKSIANPIARTQPSQVVDLIGSILDSQEFWHSNKKSGITLKADGTLLIDDKKKREIDNISNNNNQNSNNNNNNVVPTKINEISIPDSISDSIPERNIESPINPSTINPNDVTQAPMYNNSPNRGGGNRGNFRGNYRDGSRHSQGSGQGGNYGGIGGNSYANTGRHSYGGMGNNDMSGNFGNRDFGPLAHYSPNFDHRNQPTYGADSPLFRNRLAQLFRPPGMPLMERPPLYPPMDVAMGGRTNFPGMNNFTGPRLPLPRSIPISPRHPGLTLGVNLMPPPPPIVRPPETNVPEINVSEINVPEMNVPEINVPEINVPEINVPETTTIRTSTESSNEASSTSATTAVAATVEERGDDEDCDIYCDIEAPKETTETTEQTSDGTVALLPPPEPPSGLLDFDEDNSKSCKDVDSDQEDLVIDDTPKDDNNRPTDDKYDPFDANNSDSNDSHREKNERTIEKTDFTQRPMDPPPMPPVYPTVEGPKPENDPLLRLTAYDSDDADDDAPDDCPNFSIYSSASMDVARHAEQEMSQQIGPLEPPPMPPEMPDDDDVIVGDVQTCDLADIPEPTDPYVESLRKERQTLSRIPPKKITNDSRGKITFKIGNKCRINNRLSNLYDELDENIDVSIDQEKEIEERRQSSQTATDASKRDADVEKNDDVSSSTNPTTKDDKDDEETKKIVEDRDDEAKKSEQTDLDESKTSQEEIIVNKDSTKVTNATEDSVTDEDPENVKSDKSKRKSSKTEDKDDKDEEDDDDDEDDEKSKWRKIAEKSVTIDLTEKSCDTIISTTEDVDLTLAKSGNREDPKTDVDTMTKKSRRNSESRKLIEDDKSSDDNSDVEATKKRKSRKSDAVSADETSDDDEDDDDDDDRSTDNDSPKKRNATNLYLSSSERNRAGASSSFDVEDETENFPLEKDAVVNDQTNDRRSWDSDGAYTPCKDERPIKDKERRDPSSLFVSGLEPITPPKDRADDDLDVCRTPVGYAGLGTEAISETDEAMNFEDELTLLTLRKDKEAMEEGEIMDDGKNLKKQDDEILEIDDGKKKRKKKDKDKSGKDAEKNKENISGQNLVAWKKISKSTKERHYRDKDKRSKSRERDKDKDRTKEKDRDKDRDKDKDKAKSKKKVKEVTKKKEKRKELPRYDVRKIVAEKPVRPRKDEYGRDLRNNSRSKTRSPSRKRSLSRDRRSRSYSRARSRTRSRGRRSWSRNRRSPSKPRRTLSKTRRSASKTRRSLSKTRRSASKTRRSISKSRQGRSLSRSLGTVGRGRRSLSRRRSVSRVRRKRSETRRSSSKKRSPSRRRTKSPLRRRRSPSPRRRRCSPIRKPRSRSRDKKKEKKKPKSRSRSRNRKRSRSKTPKRGNSKTREKKHAKRKLLSRSRSKNRSLSRERERERNWETLNEKPSERHFPREPLHREQRQSWSAQWTPSWSRSVTPLLNQHKELQPAHQWSPPAALDGVVNVPPKNLTVILTNKEAIKKKKKEKRKEIRKNRAEAERRRKSKRTRTPPPSKEVFASGDNILVSVCFNKDNEAVPTVLPALPETIPLLPPTKRRRREPAQTENAKKAKKDRAKEKRLKSPKARKEKKKKSRAAEIAATKKPVAVIDLDQSPFREQTPSPRDVIVLSDDDDKETEQLVGQDQHAHPSSPQHDQFVSQGPKTPPEPQVKFSISKQANNLRPLMMNPLMEEEEMMEMEEMEEEEEIDERADEELELRAQEELELRLKIGPNTPPEPPSSPPTSPDAYDPFDPTKSRSPTPDASQEAISIDARNQRNSPGNHGDEILTTDDQAQMQQDSIVVDKQSTDKPKIISVMTIKRASPKRDAEPVSDGQTDNSSITDTPTKTPANQQIAQSLNNPFATINPVLATVAAAVQRSAIFNASSTPVVGQRNLQQPNRISPITQMKQRSIDRPQLPNLFLGPTKVTPIRMQKPMQNKNISTLGQNGSDATLDLTIDNTIDMSSPYSPGSSLSDGIFDPPSPGNHNGSPANMSMGNKSGMSKMNKSGEKKDPFDSLFGSSPGLRSMNKSRMKKTVKNKKSTNPKVGVRMDENQLQILDDLPSSAVEMQVKDKFLKKLNRQERVVEEVKLVLKPHYTKKHVTKEEYKDIMRKAVPKICHNKTGEINPTKIAQLIEAYVRKCRSSKRKKFPPLSANSIAKNMKQAKSLWS